MYEPEIIETCTNFAAEKRIFLQSKVLINNSKIEPIIKLVNELVNEMKMHSLSPRNVKNRKERAPGFLLISLLATLMVPRGPARTSVLLLLKRECQYSEAPSSTCNNRLEHFVQTIPQPADLHSQLEQQPTQNCLPEKISSIIHGINQSLKAHTDRHPHTVCAPKAPKFGLSILAARPASSTRATDASADAMGRSSGVTKLASTYTRRPRGSR